MYLLTFHDEARRVWFRDLSEDGTLPKHYPREFRERAIRRVTETRSDHHTEWSAIREVAARFGVGPETVRKWVHPAKVISRICPGVSESETAMRAKTIVVEGNPYIKLTYPVMKNEELRGVPFVNLAGRFTGMAVAVNLLQSPPALDSFDATIAGGGD